MSSSARQEDPLSRNAVLQVLQDLIRVPSVNATLAPDEGVNESNIAAFVCRWFADRGVKSWQEEAAPGRPNAVAQVGSGNSPILVFCAHLDTVGTAGMTIPPFDPKVEGNKVYGRGSYDMKGGVAAIMCAMDELSRSPFPGTVLAALVVDEEYASIGAQDFVRRHKADGCVLTEASEGQLVLAHKGFVWAEIVTRGRAAHGSRWDLGVSAIGKMGRIVAALEAFDQDELRQRTHPLVGAASQHCALIAGGSGLSTYSERCSLKIERRTLPGETPEQVMQELRAVVAKAGEEAEISCLLDRPPSVCPRDARLAQCARDAVKDVTSTTPEETGVGYWMDSAIFTAAGVSTLDYGPTGAGAHEAVEWVDLGSVVTTASVLVSTARRFCASR